MQDKWMHIHTNISWLIYVLPDSCTLYLICPYYTQIFHALCMWSHLTKVCWPIIIKLTMVQCKCTESSHFVGSTWSSNIYAIYFTLSEIRAMTVFSLLMFGTSHPMSKYISLNLYCTLKYHCVLTDTKELQIIVKIPAAEMAGLPNLSLSINKPTWKKNPHDFKMSGELTKDLF